MLKKLCLILSCCLVIEQLSAHEQEIEKTTSKIGHYQISANAGGVYLLNTENGDIWRCYNGFGYTWEKLPPPPIQESE